MLDVKNLYEIDDDVDFKEVTNHIQTLRFEMLKDILKDGLPSDKEDKDFLLKLLDHCDKTALSVKKLEEESSLNVAQIELCELVSNTLNSINFNPFLKDVESKMENIDLPEFETVDGEDKIGIDDLDGFLLDNGD